jgi:hypothetical protein
MANQRHNACPKCGEKAVRVLDSRDTTMGRRRRRVCDACHHRWATLEIDADVLGSISDTRRAITKSITQLTTALELLGGLVDDQPGEPEWQTLPPSRVEE